MLAVIDSLGTAIATIGTFIVAMFVFVEARRIRRAEGIFRQNQAWNDFGNAIGQFHQGTRMEALLMGKEVGPESAPVTSADDLTLIEAFLLMSFFNVVSSECHAARVNAIEERYVMHSLAMTHGVLRRNSAWIFDFLERYGYEGSFLQCLKIVERVGADVDALTPAIRSELRSVTRQWRRRRDPAASIG